MSSSVIVSGGFDDIRSRHLRLLQEAARHGPVTVSLWPDEMIRRTTGAAPKFPFEERAYFLRAVRFVDNVIQSPAESAPDALPEAPEIRPSLWVDLPEWASEERQRAARAKGVSYKVLAEHELTGFPVPEPAPMTDSRPKVVVTGCYDWVHSGHIRFFEEVSGYGALYVIVGHDANIRLLKGDGHPLLSQDERRFVVSCIRYVQGAVVSSGEGWLDADPEIRRLRPEFYAVNEDGDKGGKRDYCRERGIQYIVLKREPAPGLPRRSSTDLRGF